MLDLLKNEIVVNWIAPIITGLIVIAIPAGIIRLFKNKKDEKTITQANQRFIDSIMPFIIQKIEISSSTISDIRNVIVEESGLRDKYVYSEIGLRNKLMMDISESKYIDEDRKKELIDFTYNLFKPFNNEKTLLTAEEQTTKKSFIKLLSLSIFNPVTLFIISQLLITIVVIFDKRNIKPEENILIMLPFLMGFISILGIFLMLFSKTFESSVLRRKYRNNLFYRNYIIHQTEMIDELTKMYKNKKHEIKKENNIKSKSSNNH